MPKQPHSKFVVSADPYGAIDMTKSNMIYQPPGEPEYLEDHEWEAFLDSIITSDEPDLTLTTPDLSFPLEQGSSSTFDYPEFFEFTDLSSPEHDYSNGITADIVSNNFSIDNLLERDSDKIDETKSVDDNSYSELAEDDWDIGTKFYLISGILRKEHSSEFQSDAGLDLGDEIQGEVDDDEGDIWTKEE